MRGIKYILVKLFFSPISFFLSVLMVLQEENHRTNFFFLKRKQYSSREGSCLKQSHSQVLPRAVSPVFYRHGAAQVCWSSSNELHMTLGIFSFMVSSGTKKARILQLCFFKKEQGKILRPFQKLSILGIMIKIKTLNYYSVPHLQQRLHR